MSTTFHAEWAWRGGEGVVADVRFAVRGGRIEEVTDGAAVQPGDERIRGVVLPGLVNAHSHAFHRALRGRTHAGTGDFWTWRTQMYGVANRLNPDSYRELATCTFAEMALAGITGVGEFHYVHHPTGGGRYADPNEMGRSIVAAGAAAGVRVALLDVAYLHASLATADPLPEQQRFSDSTINAWLERIGLLGAGGDGWTVGLAPHSVRAVHPAELAEVAQHRGGRVVHLHVSEQPAENDACMAATGLTPMGVIAEAGLLGRHLTAVHATHVTDADVALLGGCGVCMCPTTERDLADGIGPARDMAAAGAVLSLGSDSHATIDLFEEARAVEHDERLSTGRRGLHRPADLLAAATRGGAASLGWGQPEQPGIQDGAPADFIAVALDGVRMAGFNPAHGAAFLIHAAAAGDVRDTWLDGRPVVRDGHHLMVPDVASRLGSAIEAVSTL